MPSSLLHGSLLEEGLAELGLGGDDRIFALLARYIEEIELFNPAYGLVKVKDREELIVKHILDSLTPLSIIRHLLNERPSVWQLADVGSGAGLPGIPLAICIPGAEFTLVERMGRRAGFLRDAVVVLGLNNVRVEEAEVERLARANEKSFDVVVFRAFKPLDISLLEKLFALLGPGGMIASYKGRRDSIEKEMAGLKKDGLETIPVEIIPLEVPFLSEERHLVLLRKSPELPQGYSFSY